MYSLNITSTNEYETNNRIDTYLEKISYRDPSALASLYEEIRVPVYNFALSIIKNQSLAEDILQETILKIYESIEKYQSVGKPMAWILTITRNLSLMKIRKNSTEVELTSIDLERLKTEEPLDKDEKILLQTLLESLSDEERQIITLYTLSGLKHREIASILDLPISTILSKYHRALKKLRKKIVGEEK